jgi:hypothetical protein
MDIAMLSMLQSQSKILTDVNTALLGKNLDTVEELGDGLVKMMEQSVTPYLGQNIDFKI